MTKRVARVAFVGFALLVALASSTNAAAQTTTTITAPGAGGTIPAPRTRPTSSGLGVTDGQRTLVVSQAADLNPAGAQLTVTGRGYDTFKGVYVTLCAIPKHNELPTPCGGGVDMEGTGGASHWISSNPPPYGRGLATPYGPDGSFRATISARAAIAAGVDCRTIPCAVVTRNDHTRSSDRSQDLFVPVTFVGSKLAVTTTIAPTTTAPPAVREEPANRTGVAAGVAVGAVIAIAAVVVFARRRTRATRPASHE